MSYALLVPKEIWFILIGYCSPFTNVGTLGSLLCTCKDIRYYMLSYLENNSKKVVKNAETLAVENFVEFVDEWLRSYEINIGPDLLCLGFLNGDYIEFVGHLLNICGPLGGCDECNKHGLRYCDPIKSTECDGCNFILYDEPYKYLQKNDWWETIDNILDTVSASAISNWRPEIECVFKDNMMNPKFVICVDSYDTNLKKCMKGEKTDIIYTEVCESMKSFGFNNILYPFLEIKGFLKEESTKTDICDAPYISTDLWPSIIEFCDPFGDSKTAYALFRTSKTIRSLTIAFLKKNKGFVLEETKKIMMKKFDDIIYSWDHLDGCPEYCDNRILFFGQIKKDNIKVIAEVFNTYQSGNCCYVCRAPDYSKKNNCYCCKFKVYDDPIWYDREGILIQINKELSDNEFDKKRYQAYGTKGWNEKLCKYFENNMMRPGLIMWTDDSNVSIFHLCDEAVTDYYIDIGKLLQIYGFDRNIYPFLDNPFVLNFDTKKRKAESDSESEEDLDK